MSNIKWIFISIGLLDLLLVIMHWTDYFFLFLKPTSYLIPIILNIVAITMIIFLSNIGSKWLVFITVTLVIFLPIIVGQILFIKLFDKNYTMISSPEYKQSLVIEYRHTVLGEIQYFYEFYKTKHGLIGKRLNHESLRLIDNDRTSSIDATAFLGANNADWMEDHTVRFFSKTGIKDVNINPSKPIRHRITTENEIENFMMVIENKVSEQSIWVKENLLTTRYDEISDQFWIDVMSKNDEGEIPTQQCSYIKKDKESGNYKLMECTHKWEYVLYPIM